MRSGLVPGVTSGLCPEEIYLPGTRERNWSPTAGRTRLVAGSLVADWYPCCCWKGEKMPEKAAKKYINILIVLDK